MKLVKDDDYKRKERKFFKKRPHLIDKYGEVLEKLKTSGSSGFEGINV